MTLFACGDVMPGRGVDQVGPRRAQVFKAAGSSNDVGCVEVAFREGTVGVRDSKPTAPVPCWVHRSG